MNTFDFDLMLLEYEGTYVLEDFYKFLENLLIDFPQKYILEKDFQYKKIKFETETILLQFDLEMFSKFSIFYYDPTEDISYTRFSISLKDLCKIKQDIKKYINQYKTPTNTIISKIRRLRNG